MMNRARLFSFMGRVDLENLHCVATFSINMCILPSGMYTTHCRALAHRMKRPSLCRSLKKYAGNFKNASIKHHAPGRKLPEMIPRFASSVSYKVVCLLSQVRVLFWC